MMHVINYRQLIGLITDRFNNWYEDDPARHVRMVGVVFARPSSPFTKEKILPQINDWNYRAEDHIDFYFPGYTFSHPYRPDPDTGFIEVAIQGNNPWLYSAEMFNEFRKKFESCTTWRYGGSAELLLLNAHFDSNEEKARLDFGSVVCCQLDLMEKDLAIESVERFFESVFRFAEEADDTDPTWKFSDNQGLKIAGSALKKVVLSLLPGLGASYEKAEHFVVKDVAHSK